MSRPLLIGQAPGPNTRPDLPLFPHPRTSAGGRLAYFLGLSRTEYLRIFDRVNLIQEFPGRWKRDDKWPTARARDAANAMRPLLAGRQVIMVGRNVATAFGVPKDMPFLQTFTMDCRRASISNCSLGHECTTTIIPHPSGRNHWYNRVENTVALQLFWRDMRENIGQSSK